MQTLPCLDAPLARRQGAGMAQSGYSFMALALREAEHAAARGEVPVGAVIVDPAGSEILARAGNRVEALNDPTAHAEILAIRRACTRLQDHELRGVVLYSTLQPCGMCTMAAIWAKVARIVFGAGRDDVHPMYFEDRHLDTMDFIRDAFRADLILEGGVLAEECAGLYVPRWAKLPRAQRVNE